MLLNMCKSCQYCLESFYWSCCEERFCFDKKIVSYRFEDVDSSWQNGYVNMGASLDSIITTQPANNNHLPQEAIVNGAPFPVGRETKEMPIHADKIYEVFSKSMIFKEDHELSQSIGSSENLDDIETKSEPDYLSDKPNRTKVYFEDEINSPITDFEIMFKDELLGVERTGMCKIDEEEENDDSKTEDEGGLVMNVEVKKPGHDLIKPSTITIKDQTKITTPNPVFEYDSSKSISNLPSSLSIPRVETMKGILRVNKDFPRSHSAKNLTRIDSTNAIKLPSKLTLTRVESLKNIETKNLNRVLARVPHRSASFLNLPEHLLPEHKVLRKSDSAFAIGSKSDSKFGQLSHLPDTPIIRSANLPRFFAESPALGEYKGETSLQSIKDKTDVILTENDYSMPRYYGKVPLPIDPIPVHESKSMPDLRIPSSSGKVSKRLVKLRSRLKPLVIKKGTDEKL